MKTAVIALTALSGLFTASMVGTGIADAERGHYTLGGNLNVYATVGKKGCATVTYPSGYRKDICNGAVSKTVQYRIARGDTFGLKITSWGVARVSCSVLDASTPGHDVVASAEALPGGTANCIRHAV